MAAVFERIAHEHCRHSEETKERKSIHPAMLASQCKIRFMHRCPSVRSGWLDLYGAFRVNRFFPQVAAMAAPSLAACSERGGLLLCPVGCGQVPGARGRGRGA